QRPQEVEGGQGEAPAEQLPGKHRRARPAPVPRVQGQAQRGRLPGLHAALKIPFSAQGSKKTALESAPLPPRSPGSILGPVQQTAILKIARNSRATIQSLAAVAQLDRVLGYEPRGRGFDSCQPHQTVSPESEKTQGFFVS